MVRIDVPAVEGRLAFTKFFSPGALYAITPCDEKTATRYVEKHCEAPFETWTIDRLRLAPPADDADVAEDPDDEF